MYSDSVPLLIHSLIAVSLLNSFVIHSVSLDGSYTANQRKKVNEKSPNKSGKTVFEIWFIELASFAEEEISWAWNTLGLRSHANTDAAALTLSSPWSDGFLALPGSFCGWSVTDGEWCCWRWLSWVSPCIAGSSPPTNGALTSNSSFAWFDCKQSAAVKPSNFLPFVCK